MRHRFWSRTPVLPGDECNIRIGSRKDETLDRSVADQLKW